MIRATNGGQFVEALTAIRSRLVVVRATSDSFGVTLEGKESGAEPIGELPPIYPEWLGDRRFLEVHGLRFPYLAGSMANGIATPRLVAAMAKAGMLGFFGAAGLGLDRVRQGLNEIEHMVGDRSLPWGANLIHSPNEPALEAKVAELYVERGVRFVEASAFMDLTPALVRLAYSGLRTAPDGTVRRPRAIFAKVSRAEVARRFMSPAPPAMLAALVQSGAISSEEAVLAAHLPVATDVTAEGDSGGHTDNRPLTALLPIVLRLRDELEDALGRRGRVRVGAAGGLGTPSAVAAAFALGADYVMTGSVNQACVESGLSEEGKRMLAAADIADVAMAASADMFELGVKLQVLKRGSLFAARANRLYELYRAHESLEAMPQTTRRELEEKTLGATVADVWQKTAAFWRARDSSELARAEADPRHRMALVFRWYLGMSSRWAIAGEGARRSDYQVWCGPAMGAFNEWVRGSFLEEPTSRTVVQVALNLLEGAAVMSRAQQLRTVGVEVNLRDAWFRPRRLA